MADNTNQEDPLFVQAQAQAALASKTGPAPSPSGSEDPDFLRAQAQAYLQSRGASPDLAAQASSVSTPAAIGTGASETALGMIGGLPRVAGALAGMFAAGGEHSPLKDAPAPSNDGSVGVDDLMQAKAHAALSAWDAVSNFVRHPIDTFHKAAAAYDTTKDQMTTGLAALHEAKPKAMTAGNLLGGLPNAPKTLVGALGQGAAYGLSSTPDLTKPVDATSSALDGAWNNGLGFVLPFATAGYNELETELNPNATDAEKQSARTNLGFALAGKAVGKAANTVASVAKPRYQKAVSDVINGTRKPLPDTNNVPVIDFPGVIDREHGEANQANAQIDSIINQRDQADAERQALDAADLKAFSESVKNAVQNKASVVKEQQKTDTAAVKDWKKVVKSRVKNQAALQEEAQAADGADVEAWRKAIADAVQNKAGVVSEQQQTDAANEQAHQRSAVEQEQAFKDAVAHQVQNKAALQAERLRTVGAQAGPTTGGGPLTEGQISGKAANEHGLFQMALMKAAILKRIDPKVLMDEPAMHDYWARYMNEHLPEEDLRNPQGRIDRAVEAFIAAHNAEAAQAAEPQPVTTSASLNKASTNEYGRVMAGDIGNQARGAMPPLPPLDLPPRPVAGPAPAPSVQPPLGDLPPKPTPRSVPPMAPLPPRPVPSIQPALGDLPQRPMPRPVPERAPLGNLPEWAGTQFQTPEQKAQALINASPTIAREVGGKLMRESYSHGALLGFLPNLPHAISTIAEAYNSSPLMRARMTSALMKSPDLVSRYGNSFKAGLSKAQMYYYLQNDPDLVRALASEVGDQ